MERFSFGSALMHFRNTEGPGSFVWKWIATYVVLIGTIYVAFNYFFLSQASGLVSMSNRTVSADISINIIGSLFGMMLLGAVVAALLLSVLETAALRRYIHKGGFSLRFGRDEFRTLGVYLCWAGLFILFYIGMFIYMMVFGMIALAGASLNPSAGLYIGLVLQIPIWMTFAYFGVRFASASAVTMRDGKVTFNSAASVVKGRFWLVLAAFAAVFLIAYAIQAVIQLLLYGPLMLRIYDPSSGPAPVETLFSPLVIAMMIASSAVSAVVMSFLHLIMLGITSKAALTDPSWEGRGSLIAEAFD